MTALLTILALVAITAAIIVLGRVLWATCDEPPAAPETQDDFTVSIARWGYLYDLDNS